MGNLPNRSFVLNYNARLYDETTHTIPKTAGQTFDEDCVFAGSAVNNIVPHLDDGYVYLPIDSYFVKLFDTSDENPLNGSDENRSLTLIYKTNFISGSSILANRYVGAYNWMIRKGVFHTSTSSFLPFTPSVDTYIEYITVKSSGESKRYNVTTNQSATASSISYGQKTKGFCLNTEYANSPTSERSEQNFYWIYISREELTDAEIQQVIDYNENINRKDFRVDKSKIDFDATGNTDSFTITSEFDWEITNVPSWATLSTTTGEAGTTTVQVSVGENAGEKRTQSIVITDEEEDTIEVSFSQVSTSQSALIYVGENMISDVMLGDSQIFGIYCGELKLFPTGAFVGLKTSPKSLSFDMDGESKTLKITSSEQWEISSDESWITFSQTTGDTGKTEITVTAAALTGEEDRTATITVVAGDYTATVPAEQQAISMFATVSLEDGNVISVNKGSSINSSHISYIEWSKDKTNWNRTTINSSTQTITVNADAGEKVYWRADAKTYGTGDSTYQYCAFNATKTYKVEGNVMSLIWADDWKDNTEFKEGGYGFWNIFKNSINLVDATKLILPAEDLVEHCYQNMFLGTGIVVAPAFACTGETKNNCFAGTFNSCPNLTTGPDFYMWKISSYINMQGCFADSPKISYVGLLCTEDLSGSGNYNWLNRTPSTGTFKKRAGVYIPSGSSGIPNGWTIIEV